MKELILRESDTTMQKNLFYTFGQNNSGGYFVEDLKHGVCEYVIIESGTADQAVEKLQTIGKNVDGFNNYCECCGERWSTWIEDDDGTNLPQIYDTVLSECTASSFRRNAVVHYLDGSMIQHILKTR